MNDRTVAHIAVIGLFVGLNLDSGGEVFLYEMLTLVLPLIVGFAAVMFTSFCRPESIFRISVASLFGDMCLLFSLRHSFINDQMKLIEYSVYPSNISTDIIL